MGDAIRVAIIGLIGSGIGGFCGIVINSKVIDYRLSQLEKKVDKHNTVIERTYALEERIALNEEKIKVANHRLADLEEYENANK